MSRITTLSKQLLLSLVLLGTSTLFSMEDEHPAPLPTATSFRPIKQQRGMLVLLYGMSSVGKSSTLKEIKRIVKGIGGWTLIAMDDIPDEELDKSNPPRNISEECFCTLQHVKEALSRGHNVVCDAVFSGEHPNDVDAAVAYFKQELRDFLIVPIFLGAPVRVIIEHLRTRNLDPKVEEHRTLHDVLIQIGRVFESSPTPPTPQHEASATTPEDDEVGEVLRLSHQDLRQACQSPALFKPVHDAQQSQRQREARDRLKHTILSDLQLPSSASPASPVPTMLQPRGLQPDIILNTGRNTPDECARVALFTAVRKKICEESEAMQIYRELKSKTFMSMNLGQQCEQTYAGFQFGRIPHGSVHITQVPGLFACYPFLFGFDAYKKISDDPTGYYAIFFASCVYHCENTCLSADFRSYCNDRNMFERNTLRHGFDIVDHERRKMSFRRKFLGSLSAHELERIGSGTIGLSWVHEHVVIVNNTQDLELIRPAFERVVLAKAERLLILFHPDEIVPTWATMVVERGIEGITCCIIDPLGKNRLEDENVRHICTYLQ